MIDNNCKQCGSNYDNEEEFCYSCTAKNFKNFWYPEDNWRVSMSSNGDQFIAQIQAGIEGETFLSVGYSYPNYAWITKDMIEPLKKALDEAWEKTEQLDLPEMMPALYNLCEVANGVYNDLL